MADRPPQDAGLDREVHLQVPRLEQVLAGVPVAARIDRGLGSTVLAHEPTPSSWSTRLLFCSISSTERMHAASWPGGGAVLLLQAHHELQDLGLDGDVERRGRLVGYKYLRVARERHRDHGPLAHAAGELVRVLFRALFGVGDADVRENLDGLLVCLGLREVLVDADGLANLVPDGEDGVEARHGVLEDHGDVVAPNLLHPLLRHLEEVLALEEDLTLGVRGWRLRVQLHHRERRDALAAAGLPDYP